MISKIQNASYLQIGFILWIEFIAAPTRRIKFLLTLKILCTFVRYLRVLLTLNRQQIQQKNIKTINFNVIAGCYENNIIAKIGDVKEEHPP